MKHSHHGLLSSVGISCFPAPAFKSNASGRMRFGLWLLGFSTLLCNISAGAQVRAYVGDTSGGLSVVDFATGGVTRVNLFPSPVLSSPVIGAALTPDGTRAYILAGDVFVLNTSDNTLLGRIHLNGTPVGLTITPDGTRLYVGLGRPSVSVINTQTDSVVAEISVPGRGIFGNQAGVSITPDGRFVYVTNFPNYFETAPGSVSVIDTSGNTVIATIPVGFNPYTMALTPDGTRLFVANTATASRSVSVISTSSNTVVDTIHLGDAGYCPYGAAVSRDGGLLYITTEDPFDTATASLTAISTGTDQVVSRTKIGGLECIIGSLPRDVAISPDGTVAYVTDGSSNSILVVAASGGLKGTIPLGGKPLFVVFANTKQRGCHVTPPVQRISQCFGKPGPWAEDIYGFHCADRATICALGCALTSLSADLQWAGVSMIPDFTSFAPCNNLAPWINPGSQNPHYLNLLMSRSLAIDDYGYPGNVHPDKTTRDVAFQTSKRLYFSNKNASLPDDLNNLDKALCQGDKGTPQPVMVGVTSQCSGKFLGHYVLVTGETIDSTGARTFQIADPVGTGSCANGRPVAPCTTLDCPAYHNHFSIWGSVTDPAGDISGLDLDVGDSAEVLVTDGSRQRVGVDPTTGQTLQEIPGSSYFSGSIDNDETGEVGSTFHSVQIFQPRQGSYAVVMTGLKVGQYQVGIKAYSQDGAPQRDLSVSGIAGVGSTQTFQLQFSSTPGDTSTVTRVASFQTTLADINNSLQLGLIDNGGIANSLAKKIEHASSSTGRDRTNVLNAFINEVEAQSGKHITGIAPQVLIEDANSLLSLTTQQTSTF